MPRIPIDDPRWDDLLDDFRRSGLTHAEFCRSRGLPLHTFRKRLYRDRTPGAATNPGASPTGTAPAFLPVTVLPDPTPAPAATHQPLELILPHGQRIAVAPGFDPHTLRLLLDVLEGRSCSA
jgi:hypothetical protein